MKKNKIFFWLTFFCYFSVSSQNLKTKEISLIVDNDLFISTYQDRYYTNGMFLSYRFLSQKTPTIFSEKIYEFKIGHHIYTPKKANVFSRSEHDRPFAAYLFAEAGYTNYYKNNQILKLSAQLGVLGASAKGKELMKMVHDIYGFKNADGWKYQITDAFALNFLGSYIHFLGSDASKKFDVSWYNTTKIGTIFNDFSTGFYGRIGLKPLQKLVNSVAFGGNLNNENTSLNSSSELFFYIKPTVSFVLYDATIQGSLFNDTSPITYPVKPLKFTTEFGLRFTTNRFNFGYSVFYHSKKLKSVQVPKANFYGSILISYLLD